MNERILTDATVIATKKTLIEMAEQSWLDLYGRGHNQLGFVESLNRFASLVRRDERNSWPNRTWVGLTQQETKKIMEKWDGIDAYVLCRAIEAELKEKYT